MGQAAGLATGKIRVVSFASEIVRTCHSIPFVDRKGLQAWQQADGKEASRTFRSLYPLLPKFTFYDDVAVARAAEATAQAAITHTKTKDCTAALQDCFVTIQPGSRRSSRERGEYSHLLSSRETAVASAIAAATAAFSAGWDVRHSPDYRDPEGDGAAVLAAVAAGMRQHAQSSGNAGSYVSSPLRPRDDQHMAAAPRVPRLQLSSWLRGRRGREVLEHGNGSHGGSKQALDGSKLPSIAIDMPIQRRDSVEDAMVRHIKMSRASA